MSNQSQQASYFQKILGETNKSTAVIHDFLQRKSQQFQEKIQEGEYQIRKQKYDLVRKGHDSYRQNVSEYLNNKSSLEAKIKELGDKKNQKVLKMTQQERADFVRQMRQQQRLSKRRRQIQIRQRQQKLREQQELQRQMRQLEFKQKKDKKRRQAKQRISDISDQQFRRSQQIKKLHRDYLNVTRQKTLSMKMQQKFQQIQRQKSQQHKRKLQEIKDSHKPLSQSQFRQHITRIKQYRTMKQEEKVFEGSSRSASVLPNYYKSHWYKEALKIDKTEDIKKEEEQKQILKAMKDKQKKYSQYIRQTKLPNIDQKLANQIDKRTSPPVKKKKKQEPKSIGLKNLQYCKEKAISKQKREQNKIKQMQRNISSSPKYTNYLQQLRKNNRTNTQSEKKLKLYDKDEPASIKLQNVKRYAQQLQQKALQREQVQRVNKNAYDQYADVLMMQALNAKLALFNE